MEQQKRDKLRHEPMRIAGRKVEADGLIEVRHPYTNAVVEPYQQEMQVMPVKHFVLRQLTNQSLHVTSASEFCSMRQQRLMHVVMKYQIL